MARKIVKRLPKSETLGMVTDCVALYIRVSTDKQADEGFSLEAQRERLIAYCTAQAWPVCQEHIYIDAGESAKSTSRPAYQRMIAAIDAGAVRRIVATKLDRLSRNTRDFLGLLDYCDAHNVGVVSLGESFDTSTPVGRAVVTILMTFAELERKQISDRVMSGKAEKARQGGFNGSAAPFGYIYADGAFTVDSDRAATVQRIFDTFLAGATMADIARELNADGTPTARGGKWASATIRWILSNGAYAGLSQWDGVETTDGTYPAIITPELYAAADARLRSLKPGKPAKVS